MATITSTTSGLWSAGGTWIGGIAPVDGDKVIIAHPGTAIDNFSTDATGYAIGSTAITLTGSVAAGSYVIGEVVRFGSDPAYYTITNWNSVTKVLTVTAITTAIPAAATVVHNCGHRVEIDITGIRGDDTTTAIDVRGVLAASRTTNNSLTVRGTMFSSIAVWPNNVHFDWGTEVDPIPAGITATCILNHSAALAASKYPFSPVWGQKFTMWGDNTKTPWTRLNGAIAIGATSMVVDAASGWAVNDWILIADTGGGTLYRGDLRQITSVAGTTIGFAATTYAHADRAVVGNLTRNVTFKPSSTSFPCGINVQLSSSGPANTGMEGRYEFGYAALEDLGVASTQVDSIIFQTRDYQLATGPCMRMMKGFTSYVTNLSGSAMGNISLFNSVGVYNPYPIQNTVIVSNNTVATTGRAGLRIEVSSADVVDTWILSGIGGNISFFSVPYTSFTRGGIASGSSQVWIDRCANLTFTDTDFGACDRLALNGAYDFVTFNNCRFGTGAGNGSIAAASTGVPFSHTGAGAVATGWVLNDCSLPLTSYTETQISTTPWLNARPDGLMKFNRPNGDDRYEWKRKNGTMYSENSVINRSNRSIKFSQSSNWGVEGLYYEIPIPVTASVPITVVGYLRKNSAFGSTGLPTATFYGQGSTPATFTMTNSVDTWEKFSLTITPTTSGNALLKIQGKSSVSTAVFYADGITYSPFNTFSRHYGYMFDFNSWVTTNPIITQTNEATVGAYTGISIAGTTITLSSNHSIQELYDWTQWWACQTANLNSTVPLTSTNGTAFTSTYNIVLNGGSLTGTGTITTTGTLTVTGSETSTVTIAASNGTTGYLNITGLSAHTVYIEDNTATQKAYSASVTGTYSYFIPNTATGTWKYVVKKAGYAYQLGTFTASTGGVLNIATNTPQKLAADGSAMYTGSSSSLCTINITGSTQANIDIGDGSVTLQEAFDETEDALVTNTGMIWLATRGECAIFRSASGNFLFMTNNWRIRRRASGDANATLLAYVSSTQGIPKDDSNGDVVIFGVVTAADIAAAVLTAMNASPPDVNIKKVNGITVIGTGTNSDPWNPA